MNLLKKTLIAAGAVLTICGPAIAGPADPGIEVRLDTVNTPVSYRRPGSKPGDPSLVTFAAYKVTITNKTTNQLNRLYARNLIASNTPGVDPVLWDSVGQIDPGATYTCTGFNTSTLNCDTNLSVAPGGAASFVVVARAPKDGPSISVTGSAGGNEGNGVGNGCCAQAFPEPAVTVLTDSTDNTQNSKVRSYLKNNGTNNGSSQLFTGDRYITKPDDQTTTFVDVPSFADLASYAIGSIEETLTQRANDSDCNTAGRFNACGTTKIDLLKPDSTRLVLGSSTDPNSKFVYITLRVDSSAIVQSTNITNVVIRYTDDDGVTTQTIMPCVNSPTTYPCIVDRGAYTGSAGKDLKGDFFWLIKHFKNGSYKVF